MKSNFLLTTALCMVAGIPAVHASETLNLTIGASHPTTLAFIGAIQSVFQPGVDQCLLEKGDDYQINWNEAYGGSLYGANATLSSVGDGIVDVGWVFIGMESSRLPLMQISAVTPFSDGRLFAVVDAMNSAHDSIPGLTAQWEDNGVVFLGASGNETYNVFLNRSVSTFDEISGLKFSAPQSLSLWLQNTGAVSKDGGLTTYYTDIQTGLAEGTISLATGIWPNKIYEVAPYIVTVDFGAAINGALVVNLDRYERLPEEVQDCLHEQGRVYSHEHVRHTIELAERAITAMVEEGSGQATPVQVIDFPLEERQRWASALPDLAGNWVADNGATARAYLDHYMSTLRVLGADPLRDWDAQ